MPCATENCTLLSVSKLAAHITHDIMFGGLAVPQTMHSSLSASRRLAWGTFCGRSGASHIRQFGAFKGTIPLQFIHGPTYRDTISNIIAVVTFITIVFVQVNHLQI